jgi:hypothetical protein
MSVVADGSRSIKSSRDEKRRVSVESPQRSSAPPPLPAPASSSSSPEADLSQYLNLFSIPPSPKLRKITEPNPLSRMTPGYDMRTIRKQVEQLRQEVVSHVEVQGSLYNQNEILWNYLKDLVSSNESNSQILEAEVMKFHGELERLHLEKASAADELRDLREKGNEIEALEREQESLQTTLEATKEKKTRALMEYERSV